jgi:hypothetical protein
MSHVLALQRLEQANYADLATEEDNDFASTCSYVGCDSCNNCSTVSNGCFAGAFASPGF